MFTVALLKIEKMISERTWIIIIKGVRERGGHRANQEDISRELERKWAYVDQQREKQKLLRMQ